MRIKTYSELSSIKTFEERFDYLKFYSEVGIETFGYNRYLNQQFYSSDEWKHIRNPIIVRDNGCDLGVEGFEIPKGVRIIIHHMNLLSKSDFINHSDMLLNPEFLITTTHRTHNAIHYGDKNQIPFTIHDRIPNDTCLWKKIGG